MQVFSDLRGSALARPDVTWSTYYDARKLLDQDIAGEFVECGVFAGAQIAMIYRAMVDSQKPQRRIHLFDTFAGVPAAGPEDHGCPAAGQFACSLETVKNNLAMWGVSSGQLVFHEGRMEETIPRFGPVQIAMLRIDCDLYAGASVALKYLYPMVVRRGLCTLDDYHYTGPRQAFWEQFGPDAIPPAPGSGTISPLSWQRV